MPLPEEDSLAYNLYVDSLQSSHPKDSLAYNLHVDSLQSNTPQRDEEGENADDNRDNNANAESEKKRRITKKRHVDE